MRILLQEFGDIGDYIMGDIRIVYRRTYGRFNHHSLY